MGDGGGGSSSAAFWEERYGGGDGSSSSYGGGPPSSVVGTLAFELTYTEADKGVCVCVCQGLSMGDTQALGREIGDRLNKRDKSHVIGARTAYGC